MDAAFRDTSTAPRGDSVAMIVLRANSAGQLRGQITALAELVASRPLADIADASRRSREEGGHRLALVATSAEDLLQKLTRAEPLLDGEAARRHEAGGIHFSRSPLWPEGKLAFLFPGQGSQYLQMLRDLVERFPEARASFDLFDDALADRLEQPLSRYVFPEPADAEAAKRDEAALTDTNVAQPALGAAGVAMSQLLGAFGVTPELVAGHSYGEFVALHAAGCFDAATLARLSEARGRFMREAAGDDGGTMAAVDAGADVLRPLVADTGVTLANLNAPKQTVISGSRAAVAAAISRCTAAGLRPRALAVACAFHSPLVAPAQRRLAALLAETPIEPPRLPVYSNTMAERYPSDPGELVTLLGAQLAQPVEWVREVEAMYRDGARVFVEVGPRAVLGGLVSRILAEREHLVVALDQQGKPGLNQFLNGLAALASEGVAVDLSRLDPARNLK